MFKKRPISSILLRFFFPLNRIISDCGTPPTEEGYSADASSGTAYGKTATVTCDTDHGWSGSPPNITCVSGTWPEYSGCTVSGGGGGGIDLSCSITELALIDKIHQTKTFTS